MLPEELADATLNDRLRNHLAELGGVPLLVIDGMRKLPATAVGRPRGRPAQAG